jgi:hypothetical protein
VESKTILNHFFKNNLTIYLEMGRTVIKGKISLNSSDSGVNLLLVVGLNSRYLPLLIHTKPLVNRGDGTSNNKI